jgi:hypothetical protein
MGTASADLPIRHLLSHVEQQFAIAFVNFGQHATKLAEITSLFIGIRHTGINVLLDKTHTRASDVD